MSEWRGKPAFTVCRCGHWETLHDAETGRCTICTNPAHRYQFYEYLHKLRRASGQDDYPPPGLEAKTDTNSLQVRESLLAADRDIREWISLAERMIQEIPETVPYRPTVDGVKASRKVLAEIGAALLAIRSPLDDGYCQFCGGIALFGTNYCEAHPPRF